VHPGKQTCWFAPFVKQRPCIPEGPVPHVASDVQGVVHQAPVHSPDAQSALVVHESKRGLSSAQSLTVPPATSVPVWHAAPPYATQSDAELHPGKQTSCMFAFSTQRPCWPALFIPQDVSDAHDEVHHLPLHVPTVHWAERVHGSPSTPEEPEVWPPSPVPELPRLPLAPTPLPP
jgi:hypothetical protein